MLYQDTLTGALHEIPDSQVSGWGLAEDPYGMGEVVYDGLGNPLGFSFKRAFGKLVKKAAPFATSMLGPYGAIINKALPIVRQALRPVARQTAQALRQQALQQLSGYGEVAPVAPMPAPPMAMPQVRAPGTPGMARRLPAGWRRPPIPYTGPKGRRVYLRCAAWPGPRGLVPVNVPQAAPIPGQAPPVIVAPAGRRMAARGMARRHPVRRRR